MAAFREPIRAGRDRRSSRGADLRGLGAGAQQLSGKARWIVTAVCWSIGPWRCGG